jgi:hypothetical protein
MGKASRDKGQRGELEVVGLFEDAGYRAFRTRQSKGEHDPDVRVRDLAGRELEVHVESKWRDKIAALKWQEKAEDDAIVLFPEGERLPVTFLRRDGSKEWGVLLRPEFFFELLTTHPQFSPARRATWQP